MWTGSRPGRGPWALLPLDALATATRFTAECVRVAIETHCAHRPEKLIVGGGGSLNPTLMAMLGDCLPGVRVLRNEELGLGQQRQGGRGLRPAGQ